MSLLIIIVVALLEDPRPDSLPILEPGVRVVTKIESTDPAVTTPAFDQTFRGAEMCGRAWRIEGLAPGEWHVDARSYWFQPYLVLRDDEGEVIAENADGLLGRHARISITVPEEAPPAFFVVEACSLFKKEGTLTVELAKGPPPELTEAERRQAEIADAKEGVEILTREASEAQGVIGDAWLALADAHVRYGEREESLPCYEEAVRAQEAGYGPESQEISLTLNNYAQELRLSNRLSEARVIFARALAIREKIYGPDHDYTATVLNNFGVCLERLGEYDLAIQYFERVLRIYEKERGTESHYLAIGRFNLAKILKSSGQYEEARVQYEKALVVLEKVVGVEHTHSILARHSLGVVLSLLHEFDAARQQFEQAIKTSLRVFGPKHITTLKLEESFALLYKSLGRYDEAVQLMEKVVRDREELFGPDDVNTAWGLHNLGYLLQGTGRHAAAEPHLVRALAVWEETYPPDHRLTVATLNSLASVYRELGRFQDARPMAERVARTWERTLGAHSYTAASFDNMARISEKLGDLGEACRWAERSLRIREELFGVDHLLTALSLNLLARLRIDQGELDTAMELIRRSLAVGEEARARQMLTLSESERLHFTRTRRDGLNTLLSLVELDGSEALQREAYDELLRWKGRVFRDLVQSRSRLLENLTPKGREQVEELKRVQARLSRALHRQTIADAGTYASELARLREERDRLERELMRAAASTRIGDRPQFRFMEIQKALPPDAAFVDFFIQPEYTPAVIGEAYQSGTWSPPRLSAWVIRQGFSAPARVDLGEVDRLENATTAFLNRIGGGIEGRGARLVAPESPTQLQGEESSLRSLLWDPLRKPIGDSKMIFLSPDGFLGGLPFETLRLDDGTYLIEHHSFVYLQNASQVATDASKPTLNRLLCVGALDYDGVGDFSWRGADVKSDESITRVDLRAGGLGAWSPLPATAREVSELTRLFTRSFGNKESSVLLLTGVDGTEERIKAEVENYSVLHLATHGYFQPDGMTSMWARNNDSDRSETSVMPTEPHLIQGLLPGLLSGLVLAGANSDSAGEGGDREDGLLTAEEISFLDLSGVDLVVLSACETGLGRASGGEGMLGLRRSFQQAGARTVISSLWKVPDAATSELMRDFYQRLWQGGQDKRSAFRSARLAMLAKNRADPSTWGAFVLSGAWR